MENTEPLAWYGLAVILVSAGFILIPYLRGKSDLLTSWNFLLTGVALYVGIGCFEVVFGFFEWQQLQWFQPTRSDVAWFMLAGTAFYAALLVCYYWNPIASSVTSRILQKWPDPRAPPAKMTVTQVLAEVCAKRPLFAPEVTPIMVRLTSARWWRR